MKQFHFMYAVSQFDFIQAVRFDSARSVDLTEGLSSVKLDKIVTQKPELEL